MTGGDSLLYGEAQRRSVRPAGWGAATVLLPYPRNLVECEELIMRMIASYLVPFMPAFWDDQDRTIEAFVSVTNTRASPLPEDRLVYSSTGGALCLLVIERMPIWKEKPKGAEFSFHGDHLAVGHWVHDAEARRWYLLARHGRGIYGAAARPYKRYATARERMHDIGRVIQDGGRYRIDEETLPLRFTTRSMIQAERAGLIGNSILVED